MSKAFSVLLLFFAAISLNAQQLIVIESNNLHCNDSVLVFTPKMDGHCGNCDNPSSEAIPTLFLLHGWSGCYNDWNRLDSLQTLSNETGFRIICPDGFYNGWYVNNIDKEKMQWKSFFDEELYPKMAQKYNLDPKKTFITGLSMGGHGAINIFIDNPERFAAAGSMSGVLNIHHTTLIEKEVTKVLGPYNEENMASYDNVSAINRLESLLGSEKILILSCGYSDYYAKSTIEFSDKCKEMKVPHITLLTPGTHSWKYWRFAVREHIHLFTMIMNGENLGY